MSQDKVNPDLEAVEAAVGSLRPAPSGIDRDRLMYLAGRAAGGDGSHHARRRAGWFWPCATAASLLAAVTFAGMWLSRGEPEVQIVYRDRPAAVPEPAPDLDEGVEEPSTREGWRGDGLRMRRLVMTEGVEAMPERSAPPSGEVETLRWRSGFQRTLEELLEG
jgi:hypothetical protein